MKKVAVRGERLHSALLLLVRGVAELCGLGKLEWSVRLSSWYRSSTDAFGSSGCGQIEFLAAYSY